MGIQEKKFHSDAYLKTNNRASEDLRLNKTAIGIYACGLTIVKRLTTMWYIVNKRKNDLLHKQVCNIWHVPILRNSVPAP